MHISDRDVEVYIMSKGGVRIETIAQNYGISRERVRQICHRIEAKKRQERRAIGLDDDLHDLTWACCRGYESRIYNALLRNGIKTMDDFMALKPEEIMDMRGLGKKSMGIILRLQEKKRNENQNGI